jgi:orotidine-5'-phosphate decarboxylase
MYTLDHWLNSTQQQEACEVLHHHGLLKYDTKRTLPLKSGGTTDVYINLRGARTHPEALDALARWYSLPLQWMQCRKFAEVPDSASCFAGLLATRNRIPYLTIRSEQKEGRVTKGKIIGDINPGDQIPIIDDVVTNGASKVGPYHEIKGRGGSVPTIVVLVDREEGWQKIFSVQNIAASVWSGMTLHHVRKFLVSNKHMERCDPDEEKKNPIIVALDGKDWEAILPLIERLRPTGCILKVNDLLLDEGTSTLLPNLDVYGRVMADFKGHDIPNTIANACRRVRPHAPWAVTVHASGGRDMVQAAVQTLAGTNTKVLAITVLTSIDTKTGREIYRARPLEQVRTLAKIAHEAGAHGFVCSPREVRELRNLYPLKTLVVPGIRSPGVNAGDQRRIGTPRSTLRAGADHLVIGREITNSENPLFEVARIQKDLNIT